MFVKLAIDYENPARLWWRTGGLELWEGVAEAADASHVIVETSIAESWLAEAARLPGWDDGPEYAPHPVTRSEVDPDEDF